MLQNKRHSSLLEIEALDYFKLDPAQVQLFEHLPAKRKPQKSGTNQDTADSSCGKKESSRHSLSEKSVESKRTTTKKQSHNTNLLYTKNKSSTKLGTRHSSMHNRGEQSQEQPVLAASTYLAGSSTTSTNSLPSISSSPSVSPSLVCPHLTLDDILSVRFDSKSAHTIGLCAKCRLGPPAGIQSPLSPTFKPSSTPTKESQAASLESRGAANTNAKRDINGLRRGYSDQQVGSKGRARRLGLGHQDDSLDHYLEPNQLQRLQMSPSLRHSVEFIRNNLTEAGQVLQVYKNGSPYEKPLRICVMRGEFATLNHLLDHINSRVLIPSGARYLFHIDGQLVYSVNELKHGSAYIVSGSRNFDFRSNSILKEQLKKQFEQNKQRAQLRKQVEQGIRLNVPMSPTEKLGLNPSIEINQKIQRNRPDLLAGRVSSREELRDAMSSRNRVTETHTSPKITLTNRATQRRTMTSTVKNSKLKSRLVETPAIVIFEKNDGESAGSPASKSQENLHFNRQSNEEKPISFVRAKSELGASAVKRKKNVTFEDSARGSSPALLEHSSYHNESSINFKDSIIDDNRHGEDHKTADSNHSHAQVGTYENTRDADSGNKDLSTSEIGIQVSDSIEGFLIDLPLPMPARSEEKKTFLRKGQGARVKLFGSDSKKTDWEPKRSPVRMVRAAKNETSAKVAGKRAKNRQIVTITERQLSLDEMEQLKDLDHGDHHSETHSITIKLDSLGQSTVVNWPISESEAAKNELGETLATSNQEKGRRSSLGENEIKKSGKSTSLDQEESERWQYPGGRESSATPAERSVSQSDANDSVHARVTTPTPSLSTAGDNNSLSLTCDNPSNSPHQLLADESGVKRELPTKWKVPVTSKLCGGVDPPDKGFTLTWVNGFNINDLYPENNVLLVEAKNLAERRGRSPSPSGGEKRHLSPTHSSRAPTVSDYQFKPSDRFHNWVCHSRHHDEILYPAGCLIVLWCRWTNEQRYYAKHTSNVSALALAALNSDLAASAQLAEPNSKTPSSVHLWSLTTLETLLVLEGDHFGTKRIYSLKLNGAESEGDYIMNVGAKLDKQLWLYTFNLKSEQRAEDEKKSSSAQSNKATNSQWNLVSVSKVNKVLQNNQLPLMIMQMKPQPKPQELSTASASQKSARENVLLSFGRRHFQVWTTDRRQQKLRLLHSQNRSSQFVDAIVKANCLARLAPFEFLVGDAEGNVNLLIVQLKADTELSPSKTLLGSGEPNAQDRYELATVSLLRSSDLLPLNHQHPQVQEQKGAEQATTSDVNCTTTKRATSITCLSRVTGNIFASADSGCALRFWRIERHREQDVSHAAATTIQANSTCRQMSCISLPRDLGFICAIVLSKYNRKLSVVEFYVISTSNAILFGTVQLQAVDGVEKSTHDTLANSSLSVVYEGHETSVVNLVADCAPALNTSSPSGKRKSIATREAELQFGAYFTCSLDYKICKWSGRNLVWKSMLPSACASMAVHPTGFVLAVGAADGTVYILDKISGLLISYFPLTPVCINCLAYSRDGVLLAAGCANGSIFILPVYERGLKYKKVSIFQSPYPVVSLQFSVDNRFMLTSVTNGPYQELILWDLPNFRYMRADVKVAADKIEWFDPICSGSEDVRAIWENANLDGEGEQVSKVKSTSKRLATMLASSFTDSTASTTVNLSCHRLVRNTLVESNKDSYVIASDIRGYLRLFRYPCYDIQQGFYEFRPSSAAVNCCRFLASKDQPTEAIKFVSSSLDGSICLWTLDQCN